MPSFIETQFPVSKLSKESYKEREAKNGQTLTGLGRWWGRKPLILVRATLLGLLMPASTNPAKDREIFLKLLTMDPEGLLRRRNKRYTDSELSTLATASENREWQEKENAYSEARQQVLGLRGQIKSISRTERASRAEAESKLAIVVEAGDDRLRELAEFKDDLQRRVFLRQPYEEQIELCDRPEQIAGPSPEAWAEINAHLGVQVANLPELIRELGQRQFGHPPRVGDAFCGGGSIPFEAARLGCEAYGSDLNPVAALLTWAALNIVGGGPEVAEKVRRAQEEIYATVDRQVTEWGIEHNEQGWRADAYLYCCEVICPETGWRVPLAPSWIIGEKPRCVAKLVPDHKLRRYDLEIHSGVSEAEMQDAKLGTVRDGYVVHPILQTEEKSPASIRQVRLQGRGKDARSQYHESGLRLWEHDDLVPRQDDVFQERLYCIRWVETYTDSKGNLKTRKHYRAPDAADATREERVSTLLRERVRDWQAKGFLPNTQIEPGDKTDEPIRTRGWTYWHHLFNSRQLLALGLIAQAIHNLQSEPANEAVGLLILTRSADYNAKLSRWHPRSAGDKGEQVFSNQALNTLLNWCTRSVLGLRDACLYELKSSQTVGTHIVTSIDCRTVNFTADAWITDPPYADAVNYHELSEFFLAWTAAFHVRPPFGFPNSSRRALAVVGSEESFRRSMVDCYRTLANHMPQNGMQVVMFTHQNASVWADLTLILWAAGLRVTSAWCIATETDSAMKKGNYVQGTVLLVLRKQTGEDTAFLDEIYPQVEDEVRAQLDSMLRIDDKESPNFTDTDYQLAAYAAALRVLTQYRNLDDIDIERELSRPRQSKAAPSPLEKIITEAVKIACDHLVPRGFDKFHWKSLGAAERFYLKGLELESHQEFRAGAYMELARGFGLREYRSLLGSGEANQTRLKTASDFGRKLLGVDPAEPFAASLVRQTLFAVKEVTASEGNTNSGRTWLRTELGEKYWQQRKTVLEILRFLARLEHTVPAWEQDAASARLLAGAVENDHA